MIKMKNKLLAYIGILLMLQIVFATLIFPDAALRFSLNFSRSLFSFVPLNDAVGLALEPYLGNSSAMWSYHFPSPFKAIAQIDFAQIAMRAMNEARGLFGREPVAFNRDNFKAIAVENRATPKPAEDRTPVIAPAAKNTPVAPVAKVIQPTQLKTQATPTKANIEQKIAVEKPSEEITQVNRQDEMDLGAFYFKGMKMENALEIKKEQKVKGLKELLVHTDKQSLKMALIEDRLAIPNLGGNSRDATNTNTGGASVSGGSSGGSSGGAPGGGGGSSGGP